MHRHNIIGFVRLENLLFGLIWTPMVKSPPITGGALGDKCRGASPNNEDIHWHRHKLCRKFGKWSFRPSPYRYSTRRFLPSTQLSFCNLSRNLSTGGSGKLAIRPTRSEPGFAVRMQNSAMLRRPGEYPPSASSEF